MFNVETGIRSLTEFKQNSTEILENLKKTNSPTILTVNGKAEVVLIDPGSYQKMVKELYLADSARRIEESLENMKNHPGIEAEEFFARLKKKYTTPKTKNEKI